MPKGNISLKDKTKMFFQLLYEDMKQNSDEYIRVYQCNNDYQKVDYFNNIDDLVDHTNNKYSKFNNTYFTLATTNNNGGKRGDLKYRYFLAFDFDKKDLGQDFTHKDVTNLFMQNRIYAHAIIDSGNGYHAYVLINKTDDLGKVEEVQQILAAKLNSDLNAIKSTQILRVPHTYNVKDQSDKKLVKTIHLANKNDKFKRYDINHLYNKYCNVDSIKVDDTKIKYTISNTNIPKCIVKMLEDGSNKGDRYKDLQNIVVALRIRNKTLNEIQQVCREWGLKSQYDDSLEYRVEHIYNNKLALELDCKECEHYSECYSRVMSDFEYSDDDIILTMSETIISKLKTSTRKGVRTMKANDLLVYSILKNNVGGLNIDEIIKELTYTKKKKIVNVALSEKTLRSALKNLVENGFVRIAKGSAKQGIKDVYIINEGKSKVELTYNISYSATYTCVKGLISTEELRLYNYMRYLHHKEQRENPTALRGNLFQINQVELAKVFGVTQGRISQMVENLVDEKILGVWYRQPSKNNGFAYNIYRLIY